MGHATVLVVLVKRKIHCPAGNQTRHLPTDNETDFRIPPKSGCINNHHRTHQVESGSATSIQGQTSQSNALVLLRAINIYRNDRQFPNYGIRTLVKVKIKSHHAKFFRSTSISFTVVLSITQFPCHPHGS